MFSELGEPRFALATETIYEGYLLHYGTSRLFRPADGDTAVLLGDYLYAHGLVRLARHEDVRAVTDLAELISICTQLRADGTEAAAPRRARLGGDGLGPRLGERCPRGRARRGSSRPRRPASPRALQPSASETGRSSRHSRLTPPAWSKIADG